MDTAHEAFDADTFSPAQLALGLDANQALSAEHAALVAKHKASIAAALRSLERALKALSEAIIDAPFAVVFEQVTQAGGHKRYREIKHTPTAIIEAYATIMLAPEARANAPLRCIGAVGVAAIEPLQLAAEVNRRKAVLKEAFRPIAELSYLATVRINGRQFNRKMPLARYILRQLEAASLNRLGAYRQIPILAALADEPAPPTPRRIVFAEQWVRSEPRKSLQGLIELAVRAGRLEDAEALRGCGIPLREYLYRPKAHQIRMRATVSVHKHKEEKTKEKEPPRYRRLMAELPVLFLHNSRYAWPELKAPSVRHEADGPRERRAAELEATAVFGTGGYFRRAHPAQRELAPKTGKK